MAPFPLLRIARLTVVALSVVLSATAQCQISSTDKSDLLGSDITLTTIYYVPSGNMEFDALLQGALLENWTLTPIGAMENIGAVGDLRDPSRTFIGLLSNGPERSIAVVRGGSRSKFHKLKIDDVLAYAPLGVYRNEFNYTECWVRMPLMIRSLQQIVRMRLAADGRRVGCSDFNVRTFELREDTLLLEQDLFNEEELRLIADNYQYPTSLVPQREVVDAIDAHKPGYALLVPVYTVQAKSCLIVYDLESGECIYLSMTNPGLRPKLQRTDMAELNEVVSRGRP